MSSTNVSNFPTYFNGPPLTSSSIGITLLVLVLLYGATETLKPDPYAHIPSLGGSLFFSRFTRNRTNTDFLELLTAGYQKFKDRGVFRIPDRDQRWHVIVTRTDYVEEIRKAPEDVLSFQESVNETLFVKDLLGPGIANNPYHHHIVQSQLTKNITHYFDDLRDEIQAAFGDGIPLTEDWTSIHTLPAILQIVARAANRIFVGLPLCRQPDYLKLNVDFTTNVVKAREILIRTPQFLRPLVARYFTPAPRANAVASKYLAPIIEEHWKKVEEYGQDYPDKPNTFLSWLMDEAIGEEVGVSQLASRILTMNFAAIHTSTLSFVHALYHLAAEPHYVPPLREEIEAVIAQEGWTKLALNKMQKLDSFFKESQRINGIGFTSMGRLSLKEFVFSDGTVIPKGTHMEAAAYTIHHDSQMYPDGDKFNGFRFSEIRGQEGLSTTNQFATTTSDYIAFGHGKLACPGRFFAANLLKGMMAHIILNYDVKTQNEGVRPENTMIGTTLLPNLTAMLMFKRRQS